jgi:hypothetical protein
MRLTKKHSKKHRGGSNSYSSASTYGDYVNGNVVPQLDRTFNPMTAGNSSNIITGVQGQNAGDYGAPSSSQMSLIQSAGSKRRGKKKRGGFVPVINQAIVPFGILAMQQSYKPRKKNYTKRYRKYKKSFSYKKKRY